MPQNSTVYTRAVRITEEYLGPAGERFLRRQIETHLKIEPDALQKKDIPQLINWTSIAFALLTNNDKDVDAFTAGLKSLTQNGR
jgi:hypothetical protein